MDAWGKSKWEKIFRQHDVIVCTPQIMLNLMRCAFLKVLCLSLSWQTWLTPADCSSIDRRRHVWGMHKVTAFRAAT